MGFTFRPARRINTPLIVGIAGPTKAGKTLSAHRLAAGLAQGGQVAMINAEGAKGHQYSDRFDYLATDITAPYRPERYTEALKAALALDPRPAVVIIDSLSHMHDGPGGMLEYHDAELDRIAGTTDNAKRQRSTWTAWIKPKAAENQFIYEMLSADCHLVLCFRAKEKLRIVKGKDPIDLGWQPIAGERVAFETIFTLVLPPHSKGVPDLGVSEMREPFDSLIPAGQPLDEETGRRLGMWASGATSGEDAVLETELLELADRVGKRAEVEKALETPRKPDWYHRSIRKLEESLAAGSGDGAERPGPSSEGSGASPLPDDSSGTGAASPAASDHDPAADSQFRIPVGARHQDRG